MADSRPPSIADLPGRPPASAGAQKGGAVPLGRPRPTRSLWGDEWRRFRRHRLAMAGAVVFLVLAGATLVGPVVYTVGINTIDFHASMARPSWAHPLGTNDLGQDMLARILWGGRI